MPFHRANNLDQHLNKGLTLFIHNFVVHSVFTFTPLLYFCAWQPTWLGLVALVFYIKSHLWNWIKDGRCLMLLCIYLAPDCCNCFVLSIRKGRCYNRQRLVCSQVWPLRKVAIHERCFEVRILVFAFKQFSACSRHLVIPWNDGYDVGIHFNPDGGRTATGPLIAWMMSEIQNQMVLVPVSSSTPQLIVYLALIFFY